LAREDLSDLKKFLKPFPPEVQQNALWLRDFIWSLYPQTNELIYDNYNALALGWSPTDRVGHTFCSIAIGRTSHNVHFGFYWGSKLSDPEKKLLGGGNQYRYLLVRNREEFPKAYLQNLMKEAYVYSMSLIKDPKQISHSKTIVKSVSSAKRKKKEK
jgi:hypothetical protein